MTKDKQTKHPRHIHEPAHAAATAQVHDELHVVEALPETLDLSDAQKKIIESLHFLSAYEIGHLRKVSPDVGAAFDATSLATIDKNTELGGTARAAQIRALIAQAAELAGILAVVAPITRLVGQNLLSVNAELAQDLGEPLKVAHSLHRSKPALLEGLASLDRWSREHHGRHVSADAPPASPVAVGS